ncbi:MAG TPA: peptide ABC transporter substrate-binding protein [Anaerolineales bacterium]|nr:peptide ABC transporter substrate-binding protein [Anaerolineales bacterium]
MKRLRWQILVVAITLIVVAVLLLSQQPILAPTLSQPSSGGIYSEGLIGSLGRLNPLLDWNNPADRDVDSLVFSGLIRFDSRGLPQPDLAESWGATPDGTVYNFTLRSDAVWQDGTPVTSDDVIFTIDLIKSNSFFPQDIKDLWNQITVTRLNAENLKFTLPEPFAPFLDYLTFGVLPKHILASTPASQLASANFNINPVGSGPYKFDHFVVENGQVAGVVLTSNDHYYGQKPYIQQVVFRYYPDSRSAYEAFKQGEVLGVGQLTSDVLPEALADPNLMVYTSSLPQMSIVLLNLNNNEVSFFQDANIRRALLLGLNREYIISAFLKGEGIVADGPILPGSWAHYDGIEHLAYDPDAAVALLKGEGYVIPASGGTVRSKTNQSLSFTLLYPQDALHTEIAKAIQQNWAQIGVQANIQGVPYDQLISNSLASRSYQAALVDLNLARTPDPDPYPFWHQSEATGGQNYSQWDNRAASEYLEQARTETDFTVRARLYRNFQVVFTKDLPSLPLYYPVYNYGVSSQVHGVQVPVPMYDTSDRLSLIADWYLVTHRTIEPTAAPAAP